MIAIGRCFKYYQHGHITKNCLKIFGNPQALNVIIKVKETVNTTLITESDSDKEYM